MNVVAERNTRMIKEKFYYIKWTRFNNPKSDKIIKIEEKCALKCF